MDERVTKNFGFEDFTFETSGNVLFRNGAVVALEPSAARVLRFFLENEGRLVSKQEILETVWAEVFTTEDVLKRAVLQIRRALGDDAANPRFIETHHRRGYRFVAGEKFEKRHKDTTSKNEKVEATAPHFDCFIGRGKEIEFLQTEFRRVLKGNGQPVLIAGEPGIGKTQTVERFIESAKNDAVPLRVRFFDYEASFLPAYDVFLDLLGEACSMILAADAKKELRRTVAEKLNVNLPEELFSGHKIKGQIATDASRAIAPLAESFVRLSRVSPLILIFDDVQWADETSRKIIGYLMRIASDAPLMIVGLTRRGEAENPSGDLRQWLEKQAVYRSFTTLELVPLSKEVFREIIGEVFCGRLEIGEISDRDLQKLHTAAGGNPYFLIETLRLLLNENVIEKKETRWHWRGIEDIPLPETIRMAARAKLVQLSTDTREIVECAAVLGDTFKVETLELMTENGGESLENCLDEAIAAQVLTEQNVSGADDCQFYHTTLRRAVYIDLSPRRRKRLHARAMHAIKAVHSNELEKFAAALAAHAENAGDHATSFNFNIQACRAAAARFDWLEAAELLARAERAAEKIQDSDDLAFLSLRGEVYMSIGRRAEAEKILMQAVSFAETLRADETANVFLNLGRTRILLGKYREAVPALEKSLSAARDDSLKPAVLIQLASAKYGLCDYDSSSAILHKIIAGESAASYNRAVALGKLGWLRSLQSRYAEGKILLEEALKFHQTAGDLRERAVLAMCLNSCEYGLGNYEAAIEYALQARREAQVVGEPYNESVAQMRIAKARIAQGLYAEAEEILTDVYAIQKNLDAPHAQAETIWLRGRTALEKGNFDEAEKHLETALQMIRSVGDRDDEFRILIDRSALQNSLGNYSDALLLSENAAKIAAEIGVSEGIGEALIAQSQVLAKLGRFDEATRAAREAVRILNEFDSGERRRAFYALASALSKTASETSEIEDNLRLAVALLDALLSRFSREDEARRNQSAKSLGAPAKDLYDLLTRTDRRTEAEEIRRARLFD